ncbi:MAG: hypothetical protein BGN92_05985 [Sphingobacteriales bacterium 41-5]|nr:MAG: hypothetical protein BGN92_05985 [Sphingobacteriales bacterium 41-5]
MNISKNIIVKGRVQGVGYRFSAKKAAEKMNITGTIKNLPDGLVEIYASGDSLNMERFIEWCHEGPNLAKVTQVIAIDIPYQGFKKFSIL